MVGHQFATRTGQPTTEGTEHAEISSIQRSHFSVTSVISLVDVKRARRRRFSC